MRFLAAATLGLLASQASLSSALTPYTLTSMVSCSSNADVVHIDYSLDGLATPPTYPGTDVYEAAYRVVKTTADMAPVSVPVSAVAAMDGTGRSEIQTKPLITTGNKDNNGALVVGQTVYQLPGTILHHQQVNGINKVTGFFEIDTVSAANANITCTITSQGGQPNIKLVPQQYTINGVPQLVTNSYNTLINQDFQTTNAAAGNTLYNFDVSPAVNIDGCFNDQDPATGAARFRVPFRVTNLAVPGTNGNNNEQGVLSIAVGDAFGNPNWDWSVSITETTGFIGKGFRDSAELSIVDWIQPSGYGYVFGRLDFPATTANITCDATGATNLILSVVDYSTIDVGTGTQTYHFITGTPDNGLNPDARVVTTVGQLNVQAAAGNPTQAPSAAVAAARKAAAKKACAAAKAKAAAAAQAAAQAAAAAAGQDAAHPCLLTVPANPLTAQGLATPYILGGLCTMADTGSFVQATIISPSTGAVFAYQPLVVQQNKKAAINPIVPQLPADAVVGIWFGSNAVFQKLVAPANAPNTLTQANCVNGFNINGQLSLFGQVAACNGANFYSAAAMAVFNGLLKVPALGTAIDGQPCPTLRSFFVVDQDPQDNLQTQYLLDANGNTAINSPANLAQLTAAAKAANTAPPTTLTNPGDNPLLSRFINPTMKCNNWMIPDLSIPGTMSVTAPIGEILAAFKQASPIARIPALDPMVVDGNGNANMGKLNAYRVALAGQAAVTNLNQASTATFCKNMVGPAGAVRLNKNVNVLSLAAGPMAGQNLFQFLQTRFAAAVGPMNLMCGKLVPGLTNPLAGGAVIAAQSAFSVSDALLVGASATDNQAMDPYAELTGQPLSQNTSSGSTFPVAIVAGAIGGVVVLIIASIVIFKVVQKRKASNVMQTTARECKV